MHWALGREEIARRDYELASDSEKSGSSEEIAEKRPESWYKTPGVQSFEEYRVHYFNATRPPQVQLPNPEIPQPIKPTAGQATLRRVSDVDLGRSDSSIMGKNIEANLTVEGKRQVSPRVLLVR